MKNKFSTRLIIHFAFIIGCALSAQAQTRTFVSGVGSDANPCTRLAPCRTFQHAHDVVAAGGEVIAIDSAGYGPIAINKSVTITGDGVYAGVNTTSGDAVTIASGGGIVVLRSLIIEGLGVANKGIYATDFSALHIERCVVQGFPGEGLFAQPLASSKMFIKDSIFRNNLAAGIWINGISNAFLVNIERTRTENNNAGVASQGANTVVTVNRSLSSGNTSAGYTAIGGVLNIERSVASHNATDGISTLGVVRVSNSTVTNNTQFGFRQVGGMFLSRGNNMVAGNNGGGAQVTGTISLFGAQ